jgi:hypothetical protein
MRTAIPLDAILAERPLIKLGVEPIGICCSKLAYLAKRRLASNRNGAGNLILFQNAKRVDGHED